MSTQVWSWLMMKPGGAYPSSEETYLANITRIDAVMPNHGGELWPDGTWAQNPLKLDGPWPQSLPGSAAERNQRYMPMAWCNPEAIVAILNDVNLQRVAADNLVALASGGRFDSPWTGVYLDLENIPYGQRQQLSSFLLLLSYKLRAAGLVVGISIKGRLGDVGAYDFGVVAQAADAVDLRCYGYPGGIGPYWWVKDCIEYALGQGIPPQRLTVGLGGFCRYWPVSGEDASQVLSHAAAMDLVYGSNSFVQWIESNENGLIRERYADVGAGHIWLHDGDTLRHDLNLIDEYGLRGMTYWVPGMEASSVWQAIAEWKQEPARLRKRQRLFWMS